MLSGLRVGSQLHWSGLRKSAFQKHLLLGRGGSAETEMRWGTDAHAILWEWIAPDPALHTTQPKSVWCCDNGDVEWERNSICWTHMVAYMRIRGEWVGCCCIGVMYWLKSMEWYSSTDTFSQVFNLLSAWILSIFGFSICWECMCICLPGAQLHTVGLREIYTYWRGCRSWVSMFNWK